MLRASRRRRRRGARREAFGLHRTRFSSVDQSQGTDPSSNSSASATAEVDHGLERRRGRASVIGGLPLLPVAAERDLSSSSSSSSGGGGKSPVVAEAAAAREERGTGCGERRGVEPRPRRQGRDQLRGVRAGRERRRLEEGARRRKRRSGRSSAPAATAPADAALKIRAGLLNTVLDDDVGARVVGLVHLVVVVVIEGDGEGSCARRGLRLLLRRLLEFLRRRSRRSRFGNLVAVVVVAIRADKPVAAEVLHLKPPNAAVRVVAHKVRPLVGHEPAEPPRELVDRRGVGGRQARGLVALEDALERDLRAAVEAFADLRLLPPLPLRPLSRPPLLVLFFPCIAFSILELVLLFRVDVDGPGGELHDGRQVRAADVDGVEPAHAADAVDADDEASDRRKRGRVPAGPGDELFYGGFHEGAFALRWGREQSADALGEGRGVVVVKDFGGGGGGGSGRRRSGGVAVGRGRRCPSSVSRRGRDPVRRSTVGSRSRRQGSPDEERPGVVPRGERRRDGRCRRGPWRRRQPQPAPDAASSRRQGRDVRRSQPQATAAGEGPRTRGGGSGGPSEPRGEERRGPPEASRGRDAAAAADAGGARGEARARAEGLPRAARRGEGRPAAERGERRRGQGAVGPHRSRRSPAAGGPQARVERGGDGDQGAQSAGGGGGRSMQLLLLLLLQPESAEQRLLLLGLLLLLLRLRRRLPEGEQRRSGGGRRGRGWDREETAAAKGGGRGRGRSGSTEQAFSRRSPSEAPEQASSSSSCSGRRGRSRSAEQTSAAKGGGGLRGLSEVAKETAASGGTCRRRGRRCRKRLPKPPEEGGRRRGRRSRRGCQGLSKSPEERGRLRCRDRSRSCGSGSAEQTSSTGRGRGGRSTEQRGGLRRRGRAKKGGRLRSRSRSSKQAPAGSGKSRGSSWGASEGKRAPGLRCRLLLLLPKAAKREAGTRRRRGRAGASEKRRLLLLGLPKKSRRRSRRSSAKERRLLLRLPEQRRRRTGRRRAEGARRPR